MLTVEAQVMPGSGGEIAEVAIAFDDEGLEYLLAKLQRLRDRKDHDHLMTPAWAGAGLSEQKQGGDAYTPVHHLRLVNIGSHP